MNNKLTIRRKFHVTTRRDGRKRRCLMTNDARWLHRTIGRPSKL